MRKYISLMQQNNYQLLCNEPIPELNPIDGWMDVEINPIKSPLIPIGIFTKYNNIFTSSIYIAEHSNSPYGGSSKLSGSLLSTFMREDVAKKLQVAQKLLPKGHYLVVFDAYRTLEVQASLYNHYYTKLMQLYPKWDDIALSIETQKYVSLPSSDTSKPSPHHTGGAVDVAIVRVNDHVRIRLDQIDARLDVLGYRSLDINTIEQYAKKSNYQEYYLLTLERSALLKNNAQMLNFGTEFDNGTKLAALIYYENLAIIRSLNSEESEAATNRRILYHAMVEAGMVPYQEEWWHFNAPESQMGAKVAGLKLATYGAVELTYANLEFENIRKLQKQAIKMIANIYNGINTYGTADGVFNCIRALNEKAIKNGLQEPDKISLSDAAIIEPQLY